MRTSLFLGICAIWLGACGDDVADEPPREDASTASTEQPATAAPPAAQGGAGGSTMRRNPLSCRPSDQSEVRCGGAVCPTTSTHEKDPCFVPCCVQHEGAERCGFRGTSTAFTTECVLPAQSDPRCDEVPQFEGCCEPTRHVCGVIGGFAPGCQTESRFATLPDPPKACGPGVSDADAGQ